MKKLMSVAVLLAVGFAFANCKKEAPEVWKCNFAGSYKEKGEMTPFTWAVTWTHVKGDNWKIEGVSAEADGKSKTSGTCDAKTCKIDEEYTAGEDKGKKFYWTGTYTDAETANENVLNTSFTGTYGPSDSDRKSMGEWAAKATCTNANAK